MSVTRQQIVDKAREFLGAEYRHMGRDENGIDCIGLVMITGQQLGIVPHNIDLPPYRRSDLHKLLSMFFSYVDEIEPSAALAGDGYILCHDDSVNRRARHLAIKTDIGILWVHWGRTLFKVVEAPMQPEQERKIVGAFRYRGIVS